MVCAVRYRDQLMRNIQVTHLQQVTSCSFRAKGRASDSYTQGFVGSHKGLIPTNLQLEMSGVPDQHRECRREIMDPSGNSSCHTCGKMQLGGPVTFLMATTRSARDRSYLGTAAGRLVAYFFFATVVVCQDINPTEVRT